jgi:hypothetical protein
LDVVLPTQRFNTLGVPHWKRDDILTHRVYVVFSHGNVTYTYGYIHTHTENLGVIPPKRLITVVIWPTRAVGPWQGLPGVPSRVDCTPSHPNLMNMDTSLMGWSFFYYFWKVLSVCQAKAHRRPATKSANTSLLLVVACCCLLFGAVLSCAEDSDHEKTF